MAKRSKRSGKPKQNRTMLFIIVGICVAALAVAVGIFWSHDARVPIDRAVRVNEGTLLVLGNSGSDADVTRWHSIGLLGTDGVIRNRAHGKGELRFLGITGDLVWLDHIDTKIHARKLSDLSLVAGIGEAVANHPALSHGYQIDGSVKGAIIARAPDQKRYKVAADGSIDRFGKDDEMHFREAVVLETSPAPAHGVTMEEAQRVVKSLDLSTPVVVTHDGGNAPVAFPDPPSFLVRTFDLYKGGQGQTLRRITLDGKEDWALTAPQLMDAVEASGQSISLVWVGPLGDDLCALVELSEFHTTDEGSYSEHFQRLVTIDPSSGAVGTSTEVRLDEEP